METNHPLSTDGAWSDRLIDRLRRWPWPLEVTLIALTAVGVLVVHLVEWLAGDLPFGRFDGYRATYPLYPFGILGFIAAQQRVSLLALERFRPASGMDDDSYGRAAASLTRQPPRVTLLATLAGGLLGLFLEVTNEGAAERLTEFPVAAMFDLTLGFVGYMMAGPWVVGVVRLLGLVARLHREAPRVDLLNPEPVRAFSAATAVVGMSLLAIITLSLATDPALNQADGELALYLVLSGLALASFVLPLWGMHRRLLAERERMLAGIGQRIEETLARAFAHVDEDRSGASELRDRMAVLVAARDLVTQQSTWPWRPETLRWLVSALVIPILLWGVTRFLEAAVQGTT